MVVIYRLIVVFLRILFTHFASGCRSRMFFAFSADICVANICGEKGATSARRSRDGVARPDETIGDVSLTPRLVWTQLMGRILRENVTLVRVLVRFWVCPSLGKHTAVKIPPGVPF